jgi:hypothetical protein
MVEEIKRPRGQPRKIKKPKPHKSRIYSNRTSEMQARRKASYEKICREQIPAIKDKFHLFIKHFDDILKKPVDCKRMSNIIDKLLLEVKLDKNGLNV